MGSRRAVGALAALLGAALAAPGAEGAPLAYQEYRCVRDGQIRAISLRIDDEANPPSCDVRYRKLTELLEHDEILWKATSGLGFCRARAEELQGKLATWGWECGPYREPRPPAMATPRTGLSTAVAGVLARARDAHAARFAGVGARVLPGQEATGDLDGDGDSDAVVVYFVEARGAGVRAAIGIFVNDGDGNFAHRISHPLGPWWPRRLEVTGGRVVLTTEGAVLAGGAGRDRHVVYRLAEGRLSQMAAE